MFEDTKSPIPLAAKSSLADKEEPASKGSVISTDLTITGNIDSKGSVTIEGQINGDVNCKSVLVQKSGTVDGSLTADDVNIYGTVNGTVTGDRVSLRETSKVEADIHHNLIELEMGTEFSGQLKRKETTEKETASSTNNDSDLTDSSSLA